MIIKIDDQPYLIYLHIQLLHQGPQLGRPLDFQLNQNRNCLHKRHHNHHLHAWTGRVSDLDLLKKVAQLLQICVAPERR